MWEEAGLRGLHWTTPSSPLLLQPAGGGPLGLVLCAGSARAPLLPWFPQRGQEGRSHPSSLCTQVHLHQGPLGPPARTGPARSRLSMPFPQEPRDPGVLVGGAKPQLPGGPRPLGCCHNAQRRLRCPHLAADLLTRGSFPLRPSSPSEANKALP